MRCYEKVLSLDESNETAKLRLFCLQQKHLADHGEEFTVNIHADLSTVKVGLQSSCFFLFFFILRLSRHGLYQINCRMSEMLSTQATKSTLSSC